MAGDILQTLTPLLLLFYGWSLSAHWSLGKLLIVSVVGLWLALGHTYRLGVLPLAYLAVLAVTSAISVDPWLSYWGLWGTYSSGLLAALSIVPYWTSIGPEDRQGLERGLRVGGCAVALVAGAQLYGLFLPEALAEYGFRAIGTLGHPAYLGAALVMCYPFCRGYEKGLIWAGLLASGSRGPWIACAVGMAYQTWPTISRRVKYWGSVAVLVLMCAAFYIRPMSDLGRIATWRAAWDAFMSRPWFGWGPGAYLVIADVFRNPLWIEAYGWTTQDHAHNLLLEAGATSGILGALTLGGFLYALWRATAYNRPARAALLAVFICGMLNPLPLVVKALCLAIAASSCPTENRPLRNAHKLCQVFALASFLSVMCLIYFDRIMTYYSGTPWSFSSQEAAYWVGLVKERVTRAMFKL